MKADAEYQRRRRAAETTEQREARLAAQRERDGRRIARKTAQNPAVKPGRPLKVEGDPTSYQSITLRQSHWDTLKRIHDKPSTAIRLLIESNQPKE